MFSCLLSDISCAKLYLKRWVAIKAIILISISIALLYGTEVFFWTALINGLAHLIFDYMKAHIIATPAMSKYEMAVKELDARGASDEEIDALDIERHSICI